MSATILLLQIFLQTLSIMIQKQVPFHLKKGGIFISSGIIDMKEQAVREALEANDAFEIIEVTKTGASGYPSQRGRNSVPFFYGNRIFLQSRRP